MTLKNIFLKSSSLALLYSISLVISMPNPLPGAGMIKEAME